METCPLATTCSECGLKFELRLVLNERLRERERFFEAARDHLWRSLLKTTKRALRPWLFWRWVVMEYGVRPGRMIAGAFLGMLLVEGAAGACAGVLLAIQWCVNLMTGRGMPWYSSWPFDGGAMGEWLFFMAPWLADRWNRGPVGAMMTLAILMQVLMPGAFMLLPQTLRRARVRRGHLLRIGLWSFVGLPMWVGSVQMLYLVLELLSWASTYLVPRKTRFMYTEVEQAIGSTLGFVMREQDLLLLGAISGWTLLWWGIAVGRYLKLERPWLITLVMGLLAFLISLLACVLHPDLRYGIGLRF
jgi:hypothetical protein